MNPPQTLTATPELATAIADYYELSMAHANQQEGVAGKQSVFDLVVRTMPSNKVSGSFTLDGVKYDRLGKRDFLINAGLEQATAYLLQAKGSKALAGYLRDIQGITDSRFLQWAQQLNFAGDLYAMREGTVFFAHEPQLRVHERFEEAQVYESLLLATVNPQTGVATTANDIATVAHKVLLEGGSRRAGSPQSALFNSRAARIGGFTASSNVAYGMLTGEKVGGTHGHSYVMLHESEESAFEAQARLHGDKATFLLDTYDVKEAFETALRVADKYQLKHFSFRIDSGDLLEQAHFIHDEMAARGYTRDHYTLTASDDLTAGKIAVLEQSDAGIDKYLVGTYVVNPPKPVSAVYKLGAFKESDESEWTPRMKRSENSDKSTKPGIKQIYRVEGADGFYKRDIIALDGEDITNHLETGDRVHELLIPIVKGGAQVYDFPSVQAISDYRAQELRKFRDISRYEVRVSQGIRELERTILGTIEHRHETSDAHAYAAA